MTIHFAAARNSNRVPYIYLRRQPVMARAANDNGGSENSDGMLHDALRHFAQHGIGAAREARTQAKQAFFAGDRQSYDWWVSICRMLDKRIATQLERETVAQGHLG